jgi:hypothetical protein
MFHRLRRAISVIVSDVVYFAPVDPPAVVDGLNIGEDAPADEADGRGRPAERKYAADLDSVGVTPGLSAANADDPSAIANAHAIFNAMNIALSSDLPASAATGARCIVFIGGGSNERSQPEPWLHFVAVHRPL